MEDGLLSTRFAPVAERRQRRRNPDSAGTQSALHLVLVLLPQSPQGHHQHAASQQHVEQVRRVLVEVLGDAAQDGGGLCALALLDVLQASDGVFGLLNELVQCRCLSRARHRSLKSREHNCNIWKC